MSEIEKVVNGYIEGVLSGAIPACVWVRKAVERQRDDLAQGQWRGLWFDKLAAEHAIQFLGFLRHSKGEWAGQTINPEPWQIFCLWVIFGWKKRDGTRRFRVAYLEVPRKNGKSTIASGVGLYLLDADGEAGAEVYSAATTKYQAFITFAEAKRMAKASPSLRKRFVIGKENIHVNSTHSKYEPLTGDSESLDGLNIHGAIVDELHAHPTRDLLDVLDTATGARRESLILEITTAGHDRNSVCWEEHEHTIKVLSGTISDDSHFGIIFTIDPDDDYFAETSWRKANPNYGISVKADDLRRKANKAKAAPSALNSFLQKHLNVWTQAVERWLPVEKWQACGQYAVLAEDLKGRPCYGALDLSSNTDTTAFVMVFPPIDGNDDLYQVLCRFWIPDVGMRQRAKRDRVDYLSWHRSGLLTATDGDVVDYGFIRSAIVQDSKDHQLLEVAFDPWGASKLTQDLIADGLTMVEFRQGFASMSPAMKETEKLLLSGKLAHGNNPILTWMASNVVIRRDPAGNIKPDKAKSRERIDGLVALIMATDRALRNTSGKKPSVYQKRGFRSF